MNFEDDSKKVITSFTPYLDLILLAVKWSNPNSDWHRVSCLIGETYSVDIPAQMCERRFEGALSLIFESECLMLLRGKVAKPEDFVWVYRELIGVESEARPSVGPETCFEDELETVDNSLHKDVLLKMEQKKEIGEYMVKLEGQRRKSIGRMWIDLTQQ